MQDYKFRWLRGRLNVPMREKMIRIFLPVSTGPKKITRLVKIQSEHIARCGTWTKPSSRVPSRSNSPGHHPQWVLAHPYPPPRPTILHLRRHSNLFSAAGWHALRPNSLSQDALLSIPYIFPLLLFCLSFTPHLLFWSFHDI